MPAAAMKVPIAAASIWSATAIFSLLAALSIVMMVPQWHTQRLYFAQLGLWQTWVSIAACLSLLMLSKRKHADTEEAWAKGALLIYVLGGLLSAILLNYGVLPRWLVQHASLALTAQVLALMVVHGCCAWLSLRSLLDFRKSR